MVTVKIGDGMGNQMYNYACGYAVSRHLGEPLCLDISECDNSTLRDFELDNFQVKYQNKETFPNRTVWQKVYKRLRRDIKYHVVKEHDMYKVDQRVFRHYYRNVYLHGYWQCLGYFKEYLDEIRQMFIPVYEQSEQVKKLVKEFHENPTCALHVRGGDLGGPSRTYFQKALRRMVLEKPKIQIIVFTNDTEKAKECLENNENEIDMCYISDMGRFSDVDEFCLMSACQNQIISNSTYSTWAAYLNTYPDRIVIAPDFNGIEVMKLPEWIVI